MKRIAAGDQKACREALSRHLAPSWRLALAYTGRNDLADDIAQEAMVRLWHAAPRWQAKARISTWLYRVVKNLSVDEQRKLKPADGEMPDRADTRPDALAQSERGEALSALDRAIADLPARQRVAISLFYFDEQSISDAATVMEMTDSAFQSLLARARNSLKDRLDGADGEMLRDLSDG